MKKLIYIGLIALLTMGCEDWLAVNDNPNNPSDVPAELALPSGQAALATRLGGNMFNYTGFFAQYWTQAPEANQYNAIDEYEIKNNFFNNDYNILFSDALIDFNYVKEQAAAQEEWGSHLASTVMMAYTYQILVDMIDKVPYTEALRGSEIPQPAWDNGSDIYTALIQELDAAIGQISSSSTVYSTDLIFLEAPNAQARMGQWVGFANAMKLKLYLRGSSGGNDYTEEIQQLLNDREFFSGDVTFGAFSDESGKRNPWYETNRVGLGTVNNIATYPIITYLRSKNDPRLELLYNQATALDDYAGNMPGWKSKPDALTEEFSTPIIDPTQPVYLFTQAELQLFIAEAELLINNDDAAAQAAYEAAIDAGLELHGLEGLGSNLYGNGNPYEWDSGSSTEEKFEQIMLQKWVSLAMVNHVEAWIELRRTGYPAVSPEQGEDIDANPTIYTPGQLIIPVVNSLGSELIKRLPYPEIASIRNENTPDQPGLTANIWWDVN